MRINLYIASATGLSRRAADKIIAAGKVTINGRVAKLGDSVNDQAVVFMNEQELDPIFTYQTILLNKPAGYVCSRNGQGSKTIYDLLPIEMHKLKPVGRLDKESSGLLLLTNDGKLAHELTHPSLAKQKVYQIKLNRLLADTDRQQIEKGIELDDGLSKFQLQGKGSEWTVTMTEGRNRQIRRTFAAQRYEVTKLHRTQFGEYNLYNLKEGDFQKV